MIITLVPEQPNKGILITAYLIPVCIYLFFHLTLPFNICDDAFITLKSSVNLSQGNGLVFNAGEKAYVLTCPLWGGLLAAGRSLGFDITSVIRVLCFFFQVTMLLSAVYLGILVTKSPATGTLFAILILTNPVYYFSSETGMEYAFFFTFILLGLILLIRKNYAWSLIAGSIALWIRFDGILIYMALFLSYLYILLKSRDKSLFRRIAVIIPSLMIVIAYFTFGYLYYGDIIPQSVQMKASESPVIFSADWSEGAINTFMLMMQAIHFGCLSFFIIAPGFFFLFTIFSLVAWYYFFSRKKYESLPLVIYTVLYVIIYIGSGNNDAAGYEWYYTPTFLLAYLFSAWGIMLALRGITQTEMPGRGFELVMLGLVLIISLVWIPITLNKFHRDMYSLDQISLSREQIFGACAVWSGKHLPENACIAGDDFGALGFFSRPDIYVMDIYGILRSPEDEHIDRIDLIKREKPEAIFLRFPKLFIAPIDSGLPGEYVWYRFSRISIGLRSDIARNLTIDEGELIQIGENLDLNSEYKW
jgi:hypothetical protein